MIKFTTWTIVIFETTLRPFLSTGKLQFSRDAMKFFFSDPFRFGADFLNVHGAVIPRVTSNAAFHNIFWSVTLHEADVSLFKVFYRRKNP